MRSLPMDEIFGLQRIANFPYLRNRVSRNGLLSFRIIPKKVQTFKLAHELAVSLEQLVAQKCINTVTRSVASSCSHDLHLSIHTSTTPLFLPPPNISFPIIKLHHHHHQSALNSFQYRTHLSKYTKASSNIKHVRASQNQNGGRDPKRAPPCQLRDHLGRRGLL